LNYTGRQALLEFVRIAHGASLIARN